MRSPACYDAENFLKNAHHYLNNTILLSYGLEYPARPWGFNSLLMRFIYAWHVFTGRADILVWREQEK